MSSPGTWLQRFLINVAHEGGCWIWQARTHQGYGVYGGRVAHREAYKRLIGPIPEGLELDHLCLRPACVNPAHLEPVTRAENARRRFSAITECKNGHPFNEQNTRFRGTFRHCRVCERQRTAEYKARKRALAVTP